MRAIDLIRAKRDGGEHTDSEIDFLVQGFTQSDIPDYQMSAWLMATLWRGLSEQETFALTRAMAQSGETLDLSGLPGVPVDKHSTGGVGDKTTLAVVPILASAGVPVAKMSGRGLGHTGGTLDKLESVPGLRVSLSAAEIIAQVREIGACLCAQTATLVPADRKLYALRDATGTVESLPLIAASIMSKKIAGGSRAVVLDVKVGGGAFMKTEKDARALALLMTQIGAAHGMRVCAVLSDMNAPLGRAVGNALELREVASLLQNAPGSEPRLLRLTRTLAAAGFVLAGRVETIADGEALADVQLSSGAAFVKLQQIVAAQGGDPAFWGTASPPPIAEARASQNGWVSAINARAVGEAAMRLGAGRAVKEDAIDPEAGIVLHKTVGQAVTAGETLAFLYGSADRDVRALAAQTEAAFTVADAPLAETPLVYETIGC